MGFGLQLGQRRHRVADDLLDGQVPVHQPVDERAVGAVFQQTPDQIGQQLPVRAHRCINPACRPVAADHLVVEDFPHAMEALKLKVPTPIGEGQNGRHGVGVVGGEQRKKPVGPGQQALRAGQIGDIGRHLAGEHRVVGKAIELRRFNFGVPIGAFYQSYHHFAVAS